MAETQELLTKELSTIDFQSMIGGPLYAVIEAQAQAAATSVAYIKKVGFNAADATDPGEPTMVTFSYKKTVESKDGTTVTLSEKPFYLTVPILTILPIPFIRVEEVTIDFDAKINSVIESTTESSSGVDASGKAKLGWRPLSVKLKGSYSNKKSSSATATTERTYTLKIHVRAVQDELPAGLEKLLGVLENNITEEKGVPVQK